MTGFVTKLDTSVCCKDRGGPAGRSQPCALPEPGQFRGSDVLSAQLGIPLRANRPLRAVHRPWHGKDVGTYAGDLADLMDALDLEDAMLACHSTGGQGVVRYFRRHGSARPPGPFPSEGRSR